MATVTADLERAATLDQLYPLLNKLNLMAGWNKPEPSLWPEPRKNFVPAHWRYDDAKIALDAAGRLINTQLAERRNLLCYNPIEGNFYPTVRTLVAAYQALLPGERARWHRHSPNALRLVLDGPPGTYTMVDGERLPMVPGDVVLTPNWCWHGHGNEGKTTAYWIDFLDVPLVWLLEGMFFEPYSEPENDDMPDKYDSPYIFPWVESQKKLATTAPDSSGRFGRMIELGNRPAMKTTALYLHALEPGKETEPFKTTAHNIYAVVTGSGVSVIDGERFAWKRGDVFCAPGWRSHTHRATDEAVLLRVTDEPVHKALEFLREVN
jgi:gentisate 1,2-dioxygenase